ncbi:putative hemagglutinin/hemolysin-related protein [Streptococcus oralis]|uniref:Putative hemagglutinin/hemolysin-related protein n=1 Tax=Streptococcus oralis TaxID=1303 RepID=A0A139P2B3_STROR|nr:putative hemagglutinin/hemolysin-related protein [Streptococcus oralis]
MVMATSPVRADEAQVNNKEQQTQAEIQQKGKNTENGQEVISEPQKEVEKEKVVEIKNSESPKTEQVEEILDSLPSQSASEPAIFETEMATPSLSKVASDIELKNVQVDTEKQNSKDAKKMLVGSELQYDTSSEKIEEGKFKQSSEKDKIFSRKKREIVSSQVQENITASLTSNGKSTTELLASDSVRETLHFALSGHNTDYSDHLIEIRFKNGIATKLTPSPVAGVQYSQQKEGNDLVFRIKPAGMKGGANYNFVYALQLTNINQVEKPGWGDTVRALKPDHKVIATASLKNKNGDVVKELGKIEHTWKVLENGVYGGTPMTANQIVGLDADNDGYVDESVKLSFFMANGSKYLTNRPVKNDYFSYGSAAFDGRYVTGFGPNEGGNTLIDPVRSYTYKIDKKEGYELTEEAKKFGWIEDEQGYHLTVTKETNPFKNENSLPNKNHPISFQIKHAKVSDLETKNQYLTITGIYTKEDGTTYQNKTQIDYSLKVARTKPQPKDSFLLEHASVWDSDITRSLGETDYRTKIKLTQVANVDQTYSLDESRLTEKLIDDREYYQKISAIEPTWDYIFKEEGSYVEVIDKKTGKVLGKLDNHNKELVLTEEQRVQEIEFKFNNTSLNKKSLTKQDSLVFQLKTRYANWSIIYKDSNIRKLTSRMNATWTSDKFTIEKQAQADLDRIIHEVSMKPQKNMDRFIDHQGGSGFHHDYQSTVKETNKNGTDNLATLTGKFRLAYLADPQLDIQAGGGFTAYYNYQGKGKTLYVSKLYQTADKRMPDVLLKLANPYVPNGTYKYQAIAFWDEVLPDVVAKGGYELGEVDGVKVTTKNSVSQEYTAIVQASEASGTFSEVRRSGATNYAYHTQGHFVGEQLDFRVTYKNASKVAVQSVYVMTSLPSKGDKQLLSKNRNSQFSVHLTKAVSVPDGWEVRYSTHTGTAEEIEKSDWLEEDKVTDWSSIRAIRWHSLKPIEAGGTQQFTIDSAVIPTEATEKSTAYLSSATKNGSTSYIESNNVSIQMADKFPVVAFTYLDVHNPNQKLVIGETDRRTGIPGSAINYDSSKRIKELEAKGYELISNGFTNEKFGSPTTYKEFQILLRHKVIESPDKIQGVQKIEYRYASVVKNGDNTLLPADKVEAKTYMRTKKVDQVLALANPDSLTAGVSYTNWSPAQTWSEINSPDIPRYLPDRHVPSMTKTGDWLLERYGESLKSSDEIVTNKEKSYTWTEIVTYSPLPVSPRAIGETTTNIQGQVQNVVIRYDDEESDEKHLRFKQGSLQIGGKKKVVELDKSSLTLLDNNGQKVSELTIENEGTYRLDKEKKTLTFTPLNTFYGSATPVQVEVVDKNGKSAVTTYTPVVERVIPTSINATSTGPQGVPQTGTPTFQGGDPLVSIDETVEPTFADGSKEKSIPGQGTYTIAPDGTITFTPDKQFVGKPAPITVKRVDKNGTPVTATYSPEFTKVTPTGLGDKTEGLQGQVQEGKVTFTPAMTQFHSQLIQLHYLTMVQL